MSATQRKVERIEVRVTALLKARITEAAEADGVSVSSFIATAASSKAEETLRRQRELRFEAEEWQAFESAIAKPAADSPELAALMSRPSMFER